MEFLRSLLRRRFAGKPVVVSPNVRFFLRLLKISSTSKLMKEIKTAYPTSVYVFLLFLVVPGLTYNSSMAILRVLAEPVCHF